MPRAASTALYFGLGAYRIGEGDGGANEDSQSQWCTGSALARQVESLHSLGAGGWALYPDYKRLFTLLNKLLKDKETLFATGMRAFEIQQQGRGASAKTLELFEKALKKN